MDWDQGCGTVESRQLRPADCIEFDVDSTALLRVAHRHEGPTCGNLDSGVMVTEAYYRSIQIRSERCVAIRVRAAGQKQRAARGLGLTLGCYVKHRHQNCVTIRM